MKNLMEERRKTEDICRYEEARKRFTDSQQHSDEIHSNKGAMNHNFPWSSFEEQNNKNNNNSGNNALFNNFEEPYHKPNSNGSELLNKVFERRA